MRIRTAKKIMHLDGLDPEIKMSAQTPYTDRQVVAAHRAYWRGLRRWKRADPTMSTKPKWARA